MLLESAFVRTYIHMNMHGGRQAGMKRKRKSEKNTAAAASQVSEGRLPIHTVIYNYVLAQKIFS